MRKAIAIGAVVAVLAAVQPAGADDRVDRAMRDEMKRSMQQLEVEELQKPYFISYTIDDLDVTTMEATFGSLVEEDTSVTRWLSVEVRVGDYALDNTNFLTMSFGGRRSGVMRNSGGFARLPVEDDYDEIRRQIWLTTDGVYKQAVESFSKKQAALKTRTLTEDLPDFSAAEPAQIVDERAPIDLDAGAARELVEKLSALFRDMPDIYNSSVSLVVQNARTRYLNSEGSSFVRDTPRLRLTVTAVTQAEDGMPLEDALVAYGRKLDDLPSEKEFTEQVKALGARMAALRGAPVMDRYNGPVLFEGQAAAEVFSQALGSRLVATRLPVTDDPRMGGMLSQMSSSLQDKIGARVLPRDMQITDDPTREEARGAVLVAGYKVDDQGVPAKPTRLVERGMLKTVLSNRTPTPGVGKSSGSARSGTIMPSNVIVSTDKPVSDEELKQELLLLVQDRGADFGVLVRRIKNPMLGGPRSMAMSMLGGGADRSGQSVSLPLVEAYKVYPDGREELIRNVEISGMSAASFRDIVAASASDTVYSAPSPPSRGAALSNPFTFSFSFGGPGGGGGPVVSWVVPSVLFEELTLKKPSGEVPKPPVVPHPAFDAESPTIEGSQALGELAGVPDEEQLATDLISRRVASDLPGWRAWGGLSLCHVQRQATSRGPSMREWPRPLAEAPAQLSKTAAAADAGSASTTQLRPWPLA